jgi:hypothetical protein
VTIPIDVSVALQGGAGALVVAFVTLVFTGKVVPGKVVDRLIRAYEQRITEKDEQIRLWRDAHDTVKKANDALISQLYQSLEIGRTTNSVLRAMDPLTPAASPTPGGPDGSGVAA